MKTIHLLCSLVVIATMTLVLGGIYPPAPEAHAQTTVSKAPQAPEKVETVNVPSKPEKPKADPPAPKPARVLSQHEQWMTAAGVPEHDWPYAEDMLNKESGWCPTKWEGEIGYCPEYHGVPATGGYGLCQSTPAHKMAVMGPGWETDPVLQMKWCHQYALKYGSYKEAKKFRDCLGYCYSPRTNTTEFKKTTWF